MEAIRRVVRSPIFREVLIYSLPALLVGLALRVLLAVRMPWGYVQYDTAEFLATPFRLLKGGTFFVDGKRGFLVPILFTIPFLLRLPALIVIPLGQHLLGLAATAMSGALARLWFRHWRWFIIPVTLFVAVNPSMLWYEQTLMGESEFLFALIFLALAGTLWALNPTPKRFGLLLGALICTAGARPEGKLFFAFGILLAALVLWGQWRLLGKCAGIMLAVALVWGLIVRQSTAPQLLYASVIQLAPDHSRLLPGVEPYIIPLRDKVRSESAGDPLRLVKVSKDIRNAIDPYLWTKARNNHEYTKVLNATLKNLCLDALMAHPAQAMTIPLKKFQAAVDSWSGYQFTPRALSKNQVDAYESDPWMFALVTGRATQDEAVIQGFVEARYRPDKVAWLGNLQGAWNDALIFWRTADRPARHPRWVHDFAGGIRGGLAVMPGMPWFYPLALLGMLAAMLCPHPSRRVHLAWVPVLLAVWYAATFVGVTNARYRFAYEPFCFVYVCLLVDCFGRIGSSSFSVGSDLRPEGPAGN